MRKHLSLVMALPIVLVLAGCAKRQEPSANAADTTGPSGDETAVAPAVADVQSATNAGSATRECRARQDEPPNPNRVTAGVYCVCDDGPDNGGLHPTTKVKGDHLHEGDPIVVGRLADPTPVRLGANARKFNRLEEGNGLSAQVPYPHVDANTGGNQRRVFHLVNISKWLDPGEGPPLGNCDKSKNIITISYCYWDPASNDWLCAQNIEGPHLGDIHAQN